MMTINILTEDNYDFSDHYQYLTDFNSIRRAFDYATNYREDEPLPFTDEDSNKLFEVISKTEPYISEEFRRIDTYTFHTKFFGTDIISNLAPDIMLALLILKERRYDSKIIVKQYISNFPMKWLAENYDISVYADFRDVKRCNMYLKPNIEFRYNGERVDDILKLIDEHICFTMKKASQSFENFTQHKLCITLDKPVTVADFYELLKAKGVMMLDKVKDRFNDFIVELPNNTLCMKFLNDACQYPNVFCVIENHDMCRLVQFHSVKYPTLWEMITQLTDLFEQEKADRLTAVVGNQHIEDFSENFIKETQYGIMIDGTNKKLSIMEQNAAVVHFYKAAEKADIQPDQIPDDIEIRYEEYNDYCTCS